jgi:hypothetical protein
MEGRIDVARRLSYHTRFLQEVAKLSPQIDVVWNMDDVKHSLLYIMDHAADADAKIAVAAAKIFLQTQDSETRRICLESLSRMTSAKAKGELLRLSQQKGLDQADRDLIISYLNNQRQPIEPIAASNEKTSGARVDQ